MTLARLAGKARQSWDEGQAKRRRAHAADSCSPSPCRAVLTTKRLAQSSPQPKYKFTTTNLRFPVGVHVQ
eukprot:1964225-Pleurochrysis_carterae.AAC.1